jgi:hypothetical protein
MTNQTNVAATPLQPIVIRPFFSEGGITIWNADCRTILPWIESCELLLTDPPYGIGKKLGRKWHGSNGKTRLAENPDWDQKAVSKWVIDQCIEKCERSCIWGGTFTTCQSHAAGWRGTRCNPIAAQKWSFAGPISIPHRLCGE